ncbi:choline/carnitine/betaine transport [Desulfosporosinus orientis DSM 765]|uniref:Choline/carnitine/betaine transport n=1 Tax=Desulfosporosinus orientis (strain ATCC 19365 / DSM 765 / NCIMB 8382 / VKM B-1628 / Singapore I) TaxID=768706 RepID=G7W685_DESOD|nr:BCCT family transporter [Desulfosporosinus orientis]AET67747.1 choline/carnitine/betaine transport [Desulfosporosinus orientis DSM 765]
MKKNNTVFIVSLAITLIIVVLGLIIPKQFADGMNAAYAILTDKFSWLYLISMFIFVAFCLVLAFSKYGKIKLGDDDSKPEYSTVSWFAMLFGAGMGIGLVFWGVAEPLNHYVSFGMNEEAANLAMRKAFMHWGFHPWAGYAVVGMALGYFQFRKKAPGLISSIFIPLLGEEGVRGPIGKLIDIFAIFATVAGVATSLGQGALQINGGLNKMFGIPSTIVVQCIIIAAIAVLYIWATVSGIDKGIKLLSDINMVLAIVLMGGALLVGPTLMDINIFTNSLGSYVNNFIADSFGINPFGDNSWLSSWTIFYWAWWIAWGPFTGTFIARISKGRTIKEFVLGVILAPSLVSMVWFAIFGGLGLNLDNGVIQTAIQNTETALFVVLSHYPLGFILSIIAVFLLITFFATSANSAIFVLSMFSSEGDLNPGKSKKILWGVLQAVLALVLLMTGGLSALQTCSIVAAFPFAIIMLLCCVCLFKALLEEQLPQKNR